MKLLIVDDSRAVHAFIKDALGGAYEFRDAYDGLQALDELQVNGDFGVILLDWEMPLLTGIETLRTLRARGIKIPVLMVTSLNDPANIQDAILSGASDYVMKPFTKDILLAKVQSLSEGALYAVA